MKVILTLCPKCAEIYSAGYRVKVVPKATTELKKSCENCGRKGGVLDRYLVQSK
jgi:hypothetical protein